MIKENYILTTGKKAYITPRTSFCGELGCGAMLNVYSNEANAPHGNDGGGDTKGEFEDAKQRNFNFYSPYSGNDNW